MEDLLLQQSEIRKCVRVLEWGSGGSTVYYPRYLTGFAVPYYWVSIEYNRNWWEKVLEEVKTDSCIRVVLFDCGNSRLRQRKTQMDEYVNYPSTLGMTWDLILVDGRKRRRCLLEASKLLSPGGVVVLHDAQREYYHCALDSFKEGKFLPDSKLWVGGQL